MAFVQCSVDGCHRKLQPILKPDPYDRSTWEYLECDLCLRPVCDKHSSEIEGRLVCDRCRQEREFVERQPKLIELGLNGPRRDDAADGQS